MKTTPLLLPLLALLLFSSSCRQEKSETGADPAAVQGGAKPEPAAVPAEKLQNRAGVIYIVNGQEPFAGKAQDFYPNGQLKWEAVIRDGYIKELHRWHENGVKELTCSFTKGTLNEVLTDALDLLETKHGILQGKFTSYDKEARQEINGEFNAENKGSELQDIEGKMGSFSGSFQHHHTTGKKSIDVTILNGYVVELKGFYLDGSPELICGFNKGTLDEILKEPIDLLSAKPTVLDGEFKFYTKRGHLLISAIFLDGQRQTFLTSIGGELVPFSLDLEMVFIPDGHFQIGSTSTNRVRNDNEDLYQVTISRNYEAGKTEVTWSQWKTVTELASNLGYSDLPPGQMGSHGDQRNTDQDPVTNVSWYDAVKWLNAFSELEGLTPVYWVDGRVYRTGEHSPAIDLEANGYRLPTEAEWEYAARGGLRGRGNLYSGSNDLDEVAWYARNSGDQTRPVGEKKTNELGLYDMSGNVFEWVHDWFGSYPKYSVTDPTGAVKASFGGKVTRGGSWDNYADKCKSVHRENAWPSYQSSDTGFRPVRTSDLQSFKFNMRNPPKGGVELVRGTKWLRRDSTFGLTSTHSFQQYSTMHTRLTTSKRPLALSLLRATVSIRIKDSSK